MATRVQAQAWFDRRLCGLGPGDFELGTKLYCTARLNPPPGLQEVWSCYELDTGVAPTIEAARQYHAVVIFADPGDATQVAALNRLVGEFDILGHEAPPMLWAPHTVSPEEWKPGVHGIVEAGPGSNGVVEEVLENGIDGIIDGEPEGFDLALKIRAKLHKAVSLSRMLNEAVNARRRDAHRADHLQRSIDCMLWDYLRVRIATSIPPLDHDLPAGEVRVLDGRPVGAQLGKGMLGTVFRLGPVPDPTRNPQAEEPETTEVVKVVSKRSVTDLAELKAMKRTIDIMTRLSSPTWAHPNVAKLYEVYHSQSSLLFRLEYGGPENLYRRLAYRAKQGPKARPLSFDKTASLISQAVKVICFLHMGPKVCHRDLKPENFIVSETPQTLTLKLADFDLAVVQETPTAMCRTPCGTLPFTAPEVLLDREYNGLAADVWSLAIVLFEVHCGGYVIEHCMEIQKEKMLPGGRPDSSIVSKIKKCWQTPGIPGNMLDEKCLQELRPFLETTRPLINGALLVSPPQRWTASQLQSHMLGFEERHAQTPAAGLRAD